MNYLKYWKEILIGVLILALMICSYIITHQKTKEITLPAQIIYKQSGNQIIYRDKDKIIYKYIPIEGGTTIDVSGTVKVKNKGICLKPGFGIGLASNNSFNFTKTISFDTKLAYWDRYSMGIEVGIAQDPMAGVWLSRHLDDVSFGIINNVELKAFWAAQLNNTGILGLGFRCNL